MIHKEIERKQFIQRVVTAGRIYGWEGDYQEVREFLVWLIEENGFNPKDYNLEPYEEHEVPNDVKW